MNNIAKCWNFGSFIFRQSSEIFRIYDVIKGLCFVGDGLRLVFECIYI